MKKPIYLYIEFFMCCLTYSYIAILYSICQCTEPFVHKKKEEEEEEKENSDTADRDGRDSTGRKKEKWGVSLRGQEAAGSSKCCLLISAAPTAPRVGRRLTRSAAAQRGPLHRRRAQILPEDQLRTAVQLICTAGLEFRWGGVVGVAGSGEWALGGGDNREKRKTGQDADICKRSDTDLEKASCSGWLVNTGVKLPCGSESVGKSQPTDSTCTFLLLMFTAR